jgi:hypothetical protein
MTTPISRDDFLKLIASVGEHLAGNWELRPNPDDWPMGAHLTDPGTRADLFLNRHEGKLHVSSNLPKDARGVIPYVEDYRPMGKRMPSINVSFDKTPQQIANAIERRLFPEYLPVLEKALTGIASSDAYDDKTEGFAAEIARIVGVESKGAKVSFYRSPHPVFAETIASADVHEDDVALELRLDYPTTKAVLEFLVKRR